MVCLNMSIKLLFISIVLTLEMANSQYYDPPTPSFYQPQNYYPSAPLPAPVLPATAYSTVPIFTQPPIFVQPSTFPAIPTFSSIDSSIPVPNYPSMPFSPLQVPAYPQPIYVSPNPYAPAPPVTTYAPMPAIIPAPNYPTAVSSKPAMATPNYPSAAVSYKPALATPKCTPPTAIAYYLTTSHETPKVLPKAVTITEKAKEVLEEKLPTPTYSCPFCTGFANVPKNSKVPPPPPCSSVLPGILEKIPTIKIADELKIKDCKLAKPSPLLAELFEHKLSGKLRFDEDLLDGFLTGLGLRK